MERLDLNDTSDDLRLSGLLTRVPPEVLSAKPASASPRRQAVEVPASAGSPSEMATALVSPAVVHDAASEEAFDLVDSDINSTEPVSHEDLALMANRARVVGFRRKARKSGSLAMAAGLLLVVGVGAAFSFYVLGGSQIKPTASRAAGTQQVAAATPAPLRLLPPSSNPPAQPVQQVDHPAKPAARPVVVRPAKTASVASVALDVVALRQASHDFYLAKDSDNSDTPGKLFSDVPAGK